MSKPWWSKKWGCEKICGITHTRLRPGKNKKGIFHTTTLSCGHSFCTYPLLSWVNVCGIESTSCPICRQMFTLVQMFQKLQS